MRKSVFYCLINYFLTGGGESSIEWIPSMANNSIYGIIASWVKLKKAKETGLEKLLDNIRSSKKKFQKQ